MNYKMAKGEMMRSPDDRHNIPRVSHGGSVVTVTLLVVIVLVLKWVLVK